MIVITDLRVPLDQVQDLTACLRKELMISDLHPLEYTVVRRSLDARGRQGQPPVFLYSFHVTVAKEDKVFRRGIAKHKKWQLLETEEVYVPPITHHRPDLPPVVVGLGPSGLFAALLLSRSGLKPILIERGQPVEQRRLDTETFFTRQQLDPESNVQFGEGGAGTFSDGKLNTLIKDPTHRGHFVFQEFVKAGAPEEILYDAKPHVGTDRLQQVVKNMREELLSLGATIYFDTKLVGLTIQEGQITGVEVQPSHDVAAPTREIPTSALFLGIGHSARDTFSMLIKSGVPVEEKPFAMGVRIEHPRAMIDHDQYKSYAGHPALSAASYKLTYLAQNGRSVYTFCMCPGGVVIASASEKGGIVVNGMSPYARDYENSNSALLVNIGPDDAASYREQAALEMGSPLLAGALFQRSLEQAAFRLGGSSYAAPIQTVGDFLQKRATVSGSLGEVRPSYLGPTTGSDLSEILPDYLQEALREALPAFGHKLPGYDRPDAILTGVESRSSSPLRILRGEDGQSLIKGLYPMGEGAGYAGGITSAAIDGMKAAEHYLNFL